MGLWMIKGFLANINMKAKNKVEGSHVVRCRTAPCVVDNWPYILDWKEKSAKDIYILFFSLWLAQKRTWFSVRMQVKVLHTKRDYLYK